MNSNGMVNYSALRKNRAGLDNYLKKTGAVSKVEFSSWSEKAQISFLVNVYNAETLQLIIDDYPVDSIKDIGGFLGSPWLQKCVDLFGEKTTLAAIEKKMIIKNYDEPRTHFALVCAAVGCPPLRREAIQASKFDSQLNDQARRFLAESEKNDVKSGKLHLSSIFRTYKSDFETTGKTVPEFVDPWFREKTSGMAVEYTKYDWALNDQARGK